LKALPEKEFYTTVVKNSASSAITAFSGLHRDQPVDAFTVWVFWLPLGGLLGLHHLYLGRYWHFVLALTTLNMLGIGWLSDAILMNQYMTEARHAQARDVAFPTYSQASEIMQRYHAQHAQ
jgi:TM2 domain-containing membrane protein YozV